MPVWHHLLPCQSVDGPSRRTNRTVGLLIARLGTGIVKNWCVCTMYTPTYLLISSATCVSTAHIVHRPSTRLSPRTLVKLLFILIDID